MGNKFVESLLKSFDFLLLALRTLLQLLIEDKGGGRGGEHSKIC